MLKIQALQFSYGQHRVLNGIDLDLGMGQIHGLAGLNGCGKTTLLQLVFGLLKPDSGQISFNGKPIAMDDTAYLEAGNYFYHRLTSREILGLFSLGQQKFEIDRWLKMFSLTGDEFTEDLSTGMRKKLAILCVIARDKDLMLLDEPFNGLDMESVMVLNSVLRELRKKGKTILITSHILETLIDNCDTIQTFSNGRIQNRYTPGEYSKMKMDFLADFEQKVEKELKDLF